MCPAMKHYLVPSAQMFNIRRAGSLSKETLVWRKSQDWPEFPLFLNEYAADSNVAPIFATKDRKSVVSLLFVISPNLETPDAVGLWHDLPGFHCCPLSGCLRNLQ